MSPRLISFESVVLGALLLATAGCMPTPEQRLPGSWGVSALSGMAQGMKMAAQDPGSGADAAEVGRAMQQIGLELRSDKTHTLVMGPNILKGTWTYEAEPGYVWLKITETNSTTPLPEGEPPLVGREFLAIYNTKNDYLSYLPVDRSGLETLKAMGTVPKGIVLRRK